MVETREHEDSYKNHGVLRSGHGGPTFADETERLNYTVTAYDVSQGTVFKQLTPTVSFWLAIVEGAGLSKWQFWGDASLVDVIMACILVARHIVLFLEQRRPFLLRMLCRLLLTLLQKE